MLYHALQGAALRGRHSAFGCAFTDKQPFVEKQSRLATKLSPIASNRNPRQRSRRVSGAFSADCATLQCPGS